MKPRTEQIAAGKLYQVYPDGTEDVKFEGSRNYKTGAMRIGKVIWEAA